MVVGNVGGQLKTASAADYYDTAVFELESRDIYLAIREAIENGAVLTKDEINFTNGKSDRYRQLFYGVESKRENRIERGDEELTTKIIEFYPEYESGMDAQLRMFIRLPIEAGEDYQLTGQEDIILLYINGSDEAMRFYAEVDGRKKKGVTVKGYSEAFGEDEVEVITRDYQLQTETEAPAGSTEAVDMETALEGTADADTPGVTETEATETGAAETNVSDTEAAETESSEAGSTDTETPENEAPDVEAPEAPENEAADINAPEEAAETEASDTEDTGAITASVSRHCAPLVAENHIEQNIEKTTAEELQEEAEKESETEAAEEPETEAVGEPETEAVGEPETEAAEELETEAAEEPKTEAIETPETEVVGETQAAQDGESAPSTETTSPEQPAATAEILKATAGEAAEQPGREELGPLKKGQYPLVGIDGCYAARAYVTDLKTLGVNPDSIDSGFYWQQDMGDGIIVELKADSEAAKFLDSTVTAEILPVSDSVREAIAQNMGITSDEVSAYDITLWDADGNQIDNQAWEGSVSVTFAGAYIEELSSGSEGLAVIHDNSELDGTVETAEAGQLDLQVLAEVETSDDTVVSELTGNAESFSIFGVVPVKPDGEMNVELNWKHYGWVTEHGIRTNYYYLEINGHPTFCISPLFEYPAPKGKDFSKKEAFNDFLENYTSVNFENMLGQPIHYYDPDTVYTQEKLLLASVIVQLGYPNDSMGLCGVNAETPVGPKTYEAYTSTRQAVWQALYDGNFFFSGADTDLSKKLYSEAKK